MNNFDKKIEEAAELAKKFEEQTNQILNDPNIPQELKDIILETRIPDDKIIDQTFTVDILNSNLRKWSKN